MRRQKLRLAVQALEREIDPWSTHFQDLGELELGGAAGGRATTHKKVEPVRAIAGARFPCFAGLFLAGVMS